jgi:ABC-type lipoprotein export system ATPase subunit
MEDGPFVDFRCGQGITNGPAMGRSGVVVQLENVCTKDALARRPTLEQRLRSFLRVIQPGAPAPDMFEHALRDISFLVDKGDLLAVAGRAEVGRSALLRLIGCWQIPHSGQIVIGGTDVTRLNWKALEAFRTKNIGWVMDWTLLPPKRSPDWYLGKVLARAREVAAAEAKERIGLLLNMLGLSKLNRSPIGTLDRNQRARVALAAALVVRPTVLVWDAPERGLSSKDLDHVFSTLRAINQAFKQTTIVGTSDWHWFNVAERIVVLEDGEISKLGQNRGGTIAFSAQKPGQGDTELDAIRTMVEDDPNLLDDPAIRDMIQEDAELRRALLGDRSPDIRL